MQQGDAVLVTWETASELGNLGFNLYRGRRPTVGTVSQPDADPLAGARQPQRLHLHLDRPGRPDPGATYYYWLEAVDVDGATSVHGPVSVDYVAHRRDTERCPGCASHGPTLAGAGRCGRRGPGADRRPGTAAAAIA
ncbi:MAG: hypothetical protein HZY76_13200 [Anaerolineae bacterium]|nr:MAG: hypothetical protein HZY76_13200 [Anaerolineae bacterium]